MIIQELKYYVIKYKILLFFLIIHLIAFFLLIGTFIGFIQQIEYESEKLQNNFENKAIYHLLDGYYESNDYENFIRKPDHLKILKNYYHELINTNDFEYLAIFDQSIVLKGKQSLKQFTEGYENGSEIREMTRDNNFYTEVKSIQINSKAIDYFKLKATKGTLWTKKDFDMPNKVMPIIMGSSYSKIFDVGQTIEIEYYNENIQAKVIGFLEKNSRIYYQTSPEFYLDNYILVPYRNYKEPTSEKEEDFQRKNYFAMNNGYIITENNIKNKQLMLKRVEAIAQKTNFEKYSFIGINPHFIQYRGLLTVMIENKNLAYIIFCCSFIINILILILIFFLQQKKRYSDFYIHYINGSSEKYLTKMQILEITIIILFSYITSWFILNKLLKISDVISDIYVFVLFICMIILINFLLSINIMKKTFLKNTNTERE
ncbi:hypothetical protein ACFSGI_02685 [Paenibacillus nicotianae]|uniref:MacB-like core domain-containing protein n=1 Tax=Paenibacillus nicotianae TaxID=1526551 RepID=A0ABW4UPG2_9BACL